MKSALPIAIIALVGAFVLGCKVEPDPEAQQKIETGAQNAWNATRQAASSAGESISKTSAQVAETSKVKGPLGATKDVDSSNISVETRDKTVYVRGTVPTQAMLDKALKMCQANIDNDYKLDFNVTVQAKGTQGQNPPITDDQVPKK